MTLRAPNLLVAGTQKAGTSYLCAELAAHPEVFFSSNKEPMFFTQSAVTEGAYLAYLQEHFGDAADERWVAEGSTLYFQSARAHDNIVAHLGKDVRFIVCLRQPTEKAVSLYMHNFRRGRLKGDEPILGLEGTPLAIRPFSLYREWCDRYTDTFGRDRLAFALYDQLVDDPAAFLAIAFEHLGLSPVRKPRQGLVNRGLPLIWDGDVLTSDPKVTKLGPGQVIPRFKRADLVALHESFLQDIEGTAAFLETDLDHWLDFPAFQEERIDEMKRAQAIKASATRPAEKPKAKAPAAAPAAKRPGKRKP